MRFVATLLAVGALAMPMAARRAAAVEPPAEDAYRVETAAIPSPVGALAGTVYRPATAGPHPAIVLAPGATPHGRAHALYVVLGRYLAARGYVVVAFDFRGHGDSKVDLGFTSLEDFDFAADVLAVDRFARTLDGVDPEHVFAVGHSRGAGLVLAALARGLSVERVVAISPPRRIPALLAAPEEVVAEHGARLAELMGREPFGVELTRALVRSWAVDRVLELATHPPLLFVDGALEEAVEKGYLESVYARLSEPKRYLRIAGANHYFGVDWWRNGVLTLPYHDVRVITDLADGIDRFLRGVPPRDEESSG